MSRATDRWHQDIDFIEDDVVVEKKNLPTGSIAFRKAGRILETLSFDAINLGGDVRYAEQELTLEYTGYHPVRLLNFVLVELSPRDYEGQQQAAADVENLLSWAGDYRNPNLANDPAAPGVHVKVGNVWRTIGTRSGAEVIRPGADPSKHLFPGDRVTFTLRVTAPSTAAKEILSSFSSHFGFDVTFEEIDFTGTESSELQFQEGCG